MPQTKEQKRKQVQQLAFERHNRNDGEQLAMLDKRLGRDVGAKKERKRLLERIASRNN